MAFPASKPHRVSRRKFGRNQTSTATGVPVAISGTGSVATITFARPVVVTGPIALAAAGLTLVSQTVVSPTVVTQTLSAAVAGVAYTLAPGDPHVATQQGGQNYGMSGTF